MVFQLAVCGQYLASGSADETIKLWRMGPAAVWPCERTLVGHTESIFSLASWRDKVVSGSADNSIRVWCAATGVVEATLTEHTDTVTALVVHDDRLFSSSLDHTIRSWAAGTWVPLRSVAAYGGESTQFAYRLAVSGGRLVSGSADASDDEDRGIQYEVHRPIHAGLTSRCT
jgi:WD40 repeat protein